MRGLKRPDALAQPAQQIALLGEAAEQGLAQVEVAVDQPGQDEDRNRESRGPRRTNARISDSNVREKSSTSGKNVKKAKVSTTNGFLADRSAR